MDKKSVVLTVSCSIVDQSEIDDKIKKLSDEGTISEMFNIPLPGMEKATLGNAHICDPKIPEDRKRFSEILYNFACATVKGVPDKIYVVKKLQ